MAVGAYCFGLGAYCYQVGAYCFCVGAIVFGKSVLCSYVLYCFALAAIVLDRIGIIDVTNMFITN